MKKNRQVCTISAKAGHKILGTKDEQAQWIEEHYKDDKVETYKFSRLAGLQDIINEECIIDDVVSIVEERVISLDYDYKRVPIDGRDTRPVRNVDEFKKMRQSADYLRRLGQRAIVDAVDYKFQRAKQGVRKTGSNKSFVARHILRGLVHEVKPFYKLDLSYSQLAFKLREYGVTLSKVKHAKSARFAANMILDTTVNRSHIRKILRLLEIKTDNNYKEFLELLLHKKITNESEVKFLDNLNEYSPKGINEL